MAGCVAGMTVPCPRRDRRRGGGSGWLRTAATMFIRLTRQAEITTEIMEIVGGAEALGKSKSKSWDPIR